MYHSVETLYPMTIGWVKPAENCVVQYKFSER